MVFFPPAKLNLGLHILGKRPDGYHALESVFLATGWTDILEVNLAPNVAAGTLETTFTGRDIPGDPDTNLVVRAHKLVQERQALPGLCLHLHKVLPMGGGLGGGSSDGTWTLRAINEVCALQLSAETLAGLAAELGSDCPFFAQDRAALVTGRGEQLEPLGVDLPLAGWWVVVWNPGIHIATHEAFAGVVPSDRRTDWRALATLPVTEWHTLVRNDFEAGVVARHAVVGDALERLRANGAAYAQMTGSGSSVFGLFAREASARQAAKSFDASSGLHVAPLPPQNG